MNREKKEKKINEKFMLDCNIFDRLLDGSITLNKSNEYYATHVQRDEINNIPNENKRNELLDIFKTSVSKVPTKSAVWGVSSWNDCSWSDENCNMYNDIMGNRKNTPNNKRDALIAETAIKNNFILITNDNPLKNAIKRNYPKAKTISSKQYSELL